MFCVLSVIVYLVQNKKEPWWISSKLANSITFADSSISIPWPMNQTNQCLATSTNTYVTKHISSL